MAKETLFGGDWRKVLIKVVLLLLVLLLIYNGISKLIKTLLPNKTRAEAESILQEQIDNPPPNSDDSSASDPETITNADADDIAAKLQVAMEGAGTDTDQMFNLLQCLNGASLQKVKFAFGIRDYNGDANKPYDLFGWFNQELEGYLSVLYWSDCVPECTSWMDGCMETYYMRQIWEKSGLLITF